MGKKGSKLKKKNRKQKEKSIKNGTENKNKINRR